MKSGCSGQEHFEKYTKFPNYLKRVENAKTDQTGIKGRNEPESVPLNGTLTGQRDATAT